MNEDLMIEKKTWSSPSSGGYQTDRTCPICGGGKNLSS
jgi:hypothetical protein